MNVIFVRHAESENNAIHDQVGGGEAFELKRHHDPLLTEVGLKQARAVAERFGREFSAATEIYCSFLRRALQTANEIAKHLPHAKVIVRRELAEVGGAYNRCPETRQEVGSPGLSPSQVKKDYPSFTTEGNLPEEMGWWGSKPREAWEAAEARADELLEWLRNSAAQCSVDSPKTIVIVTHGLWFLLVTERIKRSILGRSPPPQTHLDNTAITVIKVLHHGAFEVLTENDSVHLCA